MRVYVRHSIILDYELYVGDRVVMVAVVTLHYILQYYISIILSNDEILGPTRGPSECPKLRGESQPAPQTLFTPTQFSPLTGCCFSSDRKHFKFNYFHCDSSLMITFKPLSNLTGKSFIKIFLLEMFGHHRHNPPTKEAR